MLKMIIFMIHQIIKKMWVKKLRPIIPRRLACLLMRSPGGNRTVAHPVLRQWQSCHIVKDTPWADGGIGLSFRTIRGFFGVQWGILRLIVWVIPKQNLLLFDRLNTDGREKWSPFNKYDNTGTLSRTPGVWVRVWSSSRLYYPFGKCPDQHIIRCLTNTKCENEHFCDAHHFKSTFMCPRSIVGPGVPFDSVRRFQASLLLHTTWTCL